MMDAVGGVRAGSRMAGFVVGWRRPLQVDVFQAASSRPGDAGQDRGSEIGPVDELNYNQLAKLPLVRAYESAFRRATGLALKLVPAGTPAGPKAPSDHLPAFPSMPEGREALTHPGSKSKESWKPCPARDATSGREAGRYAGQAIADASIIVGDSHVATWICTAVNRGRPAQVGIVRARRLPAGAGARRGATVNAEVLGGAGPTSPEQLRALAELLGLFAHHVAQFLEGDRLWVVGRRGEPSWVKRAKRFVREHLAEPITGRQLAAMVHVSSRFFFQVFREATGLAFQDYVLEQRVERARTLLADPSVRIPEVAWAAGFGSVRHFSAVFRISTGKAPEDYRAEQRAP